MTNAIPDINNSNPNDMCIIYMLHKNTQTLTDYIYYLRLYERKVCNRLLPQEYTKEFEITYNPLFYNETIQLLDSN